MIIIKALSHLCQLHEFYSPFLRIHAGAVTKVYAGCQPTQCNPPFSFRKEAKSLWGSNLGLD